MKTLIALLTAIALLPVMGCNRTTSSSSGPVAVVDLDAIAQKLGKDKQILQMIEQRQLNLNEQVVATQKSLIQQLNQRKSEFGEVNEDEAKELAQLQNKANVILTTTRTQAQANLTNFQLDIVNRFRAEVKPIALEIASKKGCRVVLSKNDSVLFAFDESIDLTDEVTETMRSKLSTTVSTVRPGSDEASAKQANADSNSSSKKEVKQ